MSFRSGPEAARVDPPDAPAADNHPGSPASKLFLAHLPPMATSRYPPPDSVPSPSASSIRLPLAARSSRRGSFASLSSRGQQFDKETLSHALDAIHTTASRSDTLTTFDEFASPPPSAASGEGKGFAVGAGDLVHGGLSGLYSRIRATVGGGGGVSAGGGYGSAVASPVSMSNESAEDVGRGAATAGGLRGRPQKLSTSSIPGSTITSPVLLSAPPSRLQSPLVQTFPDQSQPPSRPSGSGSPVTSSAPSKPGSTGYRTPFGTGPKAPPSLAASTTESLDTSMSEERESRASASIHSTKKSPSNSVADLQQNSAVMVEREKIHSASGASLSGSGGLSKDNSLVGAAQSSGSSDDDAEDDDDDDEDRVLMTRQPSSAGPPMPDPSGTMLPDARQVGGAIPTLGAQDLSDQPAPTMPGQLKLNTRLDQGPGTEHHVQHVPTSADSSHGHGHAQRPALQITQGHMSGYKASRASSSDGLSSVATARQASFAGADAGATMTTMREEPDSVPQAGQPVQPQIPPSQTSQGGPVQPHHHRNNTEVLPNAVFSQMRRRILGKEFWMRDENAKDCFYCGDTFSTFRRKHHCRTCGQIFDAKCTSLITGTPFGQSGSLRVCKPCEAIIQGNDDDSSVFSEDADDEPIAAHPHHGERGHGHVEDHTKISTPTMGIPVSRRHGETKRRSAIIEFDGQPILTRPSSSRSLRSLSGRPRSGTGHKRHHSRHQHMRSINKSSILGDERVPFHQHEADNRSLLPAFHHDSIIDPDLAPFMSDEGSSEDEQVSIFAALSGDAQSHGSDRSGGLGGFLSAARRGKSRGGDKSVSGALSIPGSRGGDFDTSSNTSKHQHPGRHSRKRNLSVSSIAASKSSPRRSKSNSLLRSLGIPGLGIGSPSSTNLPGHLTHSQSQIIVPTTSNTATPGGSINGPGLGPNFATRITRSSSMRGADAPSLELNQASLQHVRRLLRQMLEDAEVPGTRGWERALMPILLQCTDDVDPDVQRSDDIDIRHYIKLKKIPGGKPGDTAYVSGVVFSKNVALKSMPRSIPQPRIMIVTFAIEYARHHQHFMSLEPVIAQEREYLRNQVNLIAALRPSLLLVERNVAGLALKFLEEEGIAVAYNVKPSVLNAVSRCTQTRMISSVDKLTDPSHLGQCASFDVKTFVNGGARKTYIYLTGCEPDLGCTIVLRGADTETLRKLKRIAEFMAYVVYNLKLETCLMRDEFVLIPNSTKPGGTLLPGARKSGAEAEKTGEKPECGSRETLQMESDKTTQRTDNGLDELGSEHPDQSVESIADTQASSAAEKTETPVEHSNEDLQRSGTTGQSGNTGTATTGTNVTGTTLARASTVGGTTLAGSIGPNMPTTTNTSSSTDVARVSDEPAIPNDVPMPSYYSDMVEKYQTKLLSASPFVKFMLPYLLVQAREQERRLAYLKRLRDQYSTENDDPEKEDDVPQQKFSLVQPEMVHTVVQKASKQVKEFLHAVHNAEYEKAMHNYMTQKRQWEAYLSGNMNLFDPVNHQRIAVLYSVVNSKTSTPCIGPEIIALEFYHEHDLDDGFTPDCTLGQYVEDLCSGAGSICDINGCDKKMTDHYRQYVHGNGQMSVFVQKYPSKIKGLHNTILMWSCCRVCKAETQAIPMSESTWKYSFAKYLELTFWSTELHPRADICPHDIHKSHVRYFGFNNVALRIQYDAIQLYEVIVPRPTVTWKVDSDLRLKNEQFARIEERLDRFMHSVRARIKSIHVESVVPEKVEECRSEVDRLTKRANEEHDALRRKLQKKYMGSRYYEIIPMNRAVRAIQEKAIGWDEAFAEFERRFFPSEKDIRRLAALQLRKIFLDRDESSASIASTEEAGEEAPQVDEKLAAAAEAAGGQLPINRKPSQMSPEKARDMLNAVVEEHSAGTVLEEGGKQKENDEGKSSIAPTSTSPSTSPDKGRHVETSLQELDRDDVRHLDLAVSNNFPGTPPKDHHQQPQDRSTSQIGTPIVGPQIAPEPPGHPAVDRLATPTPSPRLSPLPRPRDTPNGTEPSTPSVLGIPGFETPIESRIPRPVDTRREVMARPMLGRTHSQPSGAFSRAAGGSFQGGLPTLRSESPVAPVSTKGPMAERLERLGIGSFKAPKASHSLIPRSVPAAKRNGTGVGNGNETRVSTLAKHFEQLSREFEKERLRERRQRNERRQVRAYPLASSKPIVEVYSDAREAVQERNPSEEDLHHQSPLSLARPGTDTSLTEGGESSALETPTTAPTTVEESPVEERKPEDADLPKGAEGQDLTTSQQTSDMEGEGDGTDTEHSGLDDMDIIPDRILSPTDVPLDLELPKHEKTSLMRMLTSFWSERSASGWAPLDYPFAPIEHVWEDSDIIVREDEPSSIIALALSSPDYLAKVRGFRKPLANEQPNSDSDTDINVDTPFMESEEASIERNLMHQANTNIRYVFQNRSVKAQCKIFYAESFDALRRKCGVAERFVESLSRCLKWDSKGGKTKSLFLKTLDDRFVLKSLSPVEVNSFFKFAPNYFAFVHQNLFKGLPSVIAKMFGLFQVVIRNPATGRDFDWFMLVMENLFYDRAPNRRFDLKGSMRNRKIQSTGERDEVLLDENLVDIIFEQPIFVREHTKKLLKASVWNDTLFLSKQNVMDYSLMAGFDDDRREIIVGIIDCIRTYTWDKKLETWIKDRGKNKPTITSPKDYRNRFRIAMSTYILQAPNCWHQFQAQQIQKRPLKLDNKPGAPGPGGMATVTAPGTSPNRAAGGVAADDGETQVLYPEAHALSGTAL
ncbi:hypothetical protein BDY21DRAFT_382883 [Lineolata rhizophorae]|uniref:1-phosphatidylinositol-3-phosphate 5-kinase n=1 Tax=Lineolata rhizophorae TaxID=578093 RepID=A0A6A6NKW0_9PEZI|nr:hypothetical protein BDY21DRAFT_382883 [Lineolata rhizophorae]